MSRPLVSFSFFWCSCLCLIRFIGGLCDVSNYRLEIVFHQTCDLDTPDLAAVFTKLNLLYPGSRYGFQSFSNFSSTPSSEFNKHIFVRSPLQSEVLQGRQIFSQYINSSDIMGATCRSVSRLFALANMKAILSDRIMGFPNTRTGIQNKVIRLLIPITNFDREELNESQDQFKQLFHTQLHEALKKNNVSLLGFIVKRRDQVWLEDMKKVNAPGLITEVENLDPSTMADYIHRWVRRHICPLMGPQGSNSPVIAMEPHQKWLGKRKRKNG